MKMFNKSDKFLMKLMKVIMNDSVKMKAFDELITRAKREVEFYGVLKNDVFYSNALELLVKED